MFVCLCNAISDQELKRLAGEGVRCATTAYKRLGAEVQCGRCVQTADQILNGDAKDSVYDPTSTVLAAE